jgi:hypothetical protein
MMTIANPIYDTVFKYTIDAIAESLNLDKESVKTLL